MLIHGDKGVIVTHFVNSRDSAGGAASLGGDRALQIDVIAMWRRESCEFELVVTIKRERDGVLCKA